MLPSVIAVQSMHTELNAVRADLAAMISQPNADELRYYEKHMDEALAVIKRHHDIYQELLRNTADGYAPRPAYRPETKFERRGLRLGHGVWDLVFRRTEA